MIKIDFHIHTFSTIKDDGFEFDLQKLYQYVNEKELDVIAITNHNFFDKKQFDLISKEINAVVFPGMEVDIDNAHLLIICDNTDINKDNLEQASNILKKLIVDKESFITFDEFVNIFPNYKNYILIPHYQKKPKMNNVTIKKFSGLIKCGEVPNSKKFLSIIKDNKKLIPVVFSDFRASSKIPLPNRYTYLDCSHTEFSNIRCALEDRDKVSISKRNLANEIEYLPDGSTISSKLNVILGTRTSGKTFNIKKIRDTFDANSCLYVPQFSLTGQAEDTKFSELIKKECNEIADNFYSKFKPLVKKLLSFDIKTLENNLEEQLDELIEYAKNDYMDVFAQTKIFSEVEFYINEVNEPEEVIKSFSKIYTTKWNKNIIEEYFEKSLIKKVTLLLIDKYKIEIKEKKLKLCTNELIKKVKKELTKESSSNAPESMDLINIFKNKKIIEKSNDLFPKLKLIREIDKQNLQLFEVIIKSEGYDNVKDIKTNLKTRESIKSIFDEYYKTNNLYEYIWELKNMGFNLNDICKSFINIEYDVKNRQGDYPSGGEKAEFNLLKEIDNANKYDALLIDEPEASFDNPFINNNIVSALKQISEKTTVCIATHNSTLAMMLNPNKIIFTENNKGVHKIYYGTMGDKVFKSSDGEEIISYDKILDVLEAGKEVYDVKGRKYENFRNN